MGGIADQEQPVLMPFGKAVGFHVEKMNVCEVMDGGAASVQIITDDQGNTGSGGPLTDFRGSVIGMNTAIATQRNNPFEPSLRALSRLIQQLCGQHF